MGQAKRKAKHRAETDRLVKSFDFARLAAAINKLTDAASSHAGGDCYTHVVLAHEILARHGIDSTITIGFAAFRVGNGSGDVIVHGPMPDTPYQPSAVPYHAWVEIGSYIFDSSVKQLRRKAAELDALDGGHTNVEWCPDYLLVKKDTVSSLKDVIQLGAGLYNYQHNKQVQDFIISTAPPVDQEDALVALAIFCDPTLIVVGPNSAPVAGGQR